MVLFELMLSAFLLFLGIYGLISTYKMDANSQKKMAKNPDSTIFSMLPLWLVKLIFFILCLLPIAIVTGMWLQKYGVIE